MDNIEITAYIPTKNRYHTTLSLAVMSVINQTYKPKKLIIIDDGEKRDLRTDATYGYIFNTLDAKGIEWTVMFGANTGVTFNHQLALDECKTEWLWRMDDDCVADPNVLETLIKNIDDKTGAIGGCVINPQLNMYCRIASSNIEDYRLCKNEQWFIPENKSVKVVDHLYSSFLYRKAASKHGYNLKLSPIANTEETWFTYEMKRNGWDIKFDPNCVTYHFQNPEGGNRSYYDGTLWQKDYDMFMGQLKNWGVNVKEYFHVVLNNGLGDHYAFKSILPKIQDKHKDKTILIACCYPDIFSDYPELNNIKLLSIDHYLKSFGDDSKYNVYKYLADHANKKLTLIQAFERMYL